MTLVIDTDIFIDFLRGVKASRDFIRGQLASGEVTAFSAITETELISGKVCEDREKREEILDILSLHTKVIVDNSIALLAGDLRRVHGLSVTDAIIAATAIQTKSKLATRNIKDFERIEGADILKPY